MVRAGETKLIGTGRECDRESTFGVGRQLAIRYAIDFDLNKRNGATGRGVKYGAGDITLSGGLCGSYGQGSDQYEAIS
jgi:hypothetical protein